MNLTDMSKIAKSTSKLRDKFYTDSQEHTELFFKDLAGEVVEATAAGIRYRDSGKTCGIDKLGEELADVIITTMVIAARYDVDLEKAVTDKLAYNIERDNCKEPY
jgi:NTP pyrophosphatase (non-canonical NTP hydrolase)